jgi:hypothetical protein
VASDQSESSPSVAGLAINYRTDLYLDSSASYQVAQQVAGLDRLVASEQTLCRRLHGHGLLVSIDTGRQTLLVRKTLEGCPPRLFKSGSAKPPDPSHSFE